MGFLMVIELKVEVNLRMKMVMIDGDGGLCGHSGGDYGGHGDGIKVVMENLVMEAMICDDG